jgi:hypothetical protein
MDLAHQKEQLSLAYAEVVAAVAGYAGSEPSVDDDSIDMAFLADPEQLSRMMERVEGASRPSCRRTNSCVR